MSQSAQRGQGNERVNSAEVSPSSADLEKFLFALQQALIDLISPRIRAITAWTEGRKHGFTIFVHGPIHEEDVEDMSVVETELLAHYPAGHQVSHEIVRLDAPALIPQGQWFTYKRKESGG